ncbi:nuclear transport factor 2 family protein [Actinocorallia populi]|uniref:nuclear transport factor 2 family protein n=1 Tax=Actinocorallia populi TaxID=2079200 RepID=UPI000D08822C|nr:nuclear transport factor 2 family protein [Actinocorallia populi]
MDDLEAVKQLKARYCRTLDTKDWDAMRRLFTDDVVVDTTGSGGGTVTGADAFMAFLRQALADVVSVHHCHTPEITIISPSEATGIWAMEDRIRWADGRELLGFGHYHETYDKTGGVWRIKTSTLTRLRLDLTEPAAPGPGGST